MHSYEGPSDTYQVRDVKFKGEQEEKLRKHLLAEIDRAKNEREPLVAKWKVWVQQANSRLKRDDAGARESKLDMTLTRERMQQNASRLKNPIFQQDELFISRPRKPQFEDACRSYDRALDYAFDRIDTRALLDDWIEQAQIFPAGFVKTPFVHEVKKVRKWEEIDLGTQQAMIDAGEAIVSVEQNNKVFVERTDSVEKRSGAFPFVVPLEDMFFPLGAKDVDSAPWIAHRMWENQADVKCKIRYGVYKKKVDGEDTLRALGKPTEERERLMQFAEESKVEDSDSKKQHEIFEIYLAWDVDEDGEEEEIIVTMDGGSGIFLRCCHNFYHNYNRPFVFWNYKRVNGSIYGIPLTYQLEPLHRAYSASFNQRLDAASKANEKMLFFPPGSGIDEILDQHRLQGGAWEINIDPGEIKEFGITQHFDQLPELEGRLEQRADMIAGLSAYSFGNEQIDRPTATGQVQIIEESKQPMYDQLESFRRAFADVAKHVLARYIQFFPAGMEIYSALDQEEGQAMANFVTWPEGAFEENAVIETAVSSANMSKQLRKQEMVALVDKYPQMIQGLIGMIQQSSDINNPAAPSIQMLITGYQVVIDKFLSEFEVSKKQALNPPNLLQGIEYGQMVTQQMQQLNSQIQQLGMENQKLKMQMQGPPMGPPGMGPPGMGPGPMQGPPPGMGGPPQGPMPGPPGPMGGAPNVPPMQGGPAPAPPGM